ncbi:DNA-binding MarR family transcriptional regulator [Leifsonia sp. AK011]|uniref:MarR family winged helix-turn-helix transcriptional regulator n=1 Tax=Leifsonia sp. AK011 TaxID=2723075 RepID=UPI0015C86267|nr:MarR family transcriptional regulator [Leifsonia sp. AK011]NYF10899.1 DNA-binding MarR family transcriptional regulator [Leifsonia sp. AK011]
MRAAEQLRYAVLAAQRDGNRRLSFELGRLGLTPSQAEVLRLLVDGAPLSLTELGRLLVCESGTNPSRLVDRMVVADLVTRGQDPNDRRLVTLTPTERGRALDADVRGIEERLYDEIDAATVGLDLERLVGLLSGLATGDAGEALARRVSAS